MEIFISSGKLTPIRELMRATVIQGWHELGENPLVCWHGFPQRWRTAESSSRSHVFCLADDDCLPCPDLDLERIEEVFRLNPAYGIIALADIHGNVKRDWIVESTCVGGIRFIRKGCVTEFPESFSGCDSEYYDLMNKAGYKSGICTEFTRLHMGIYHSLWQRRDKCPR